MKEYKTPNFGYARKCCRNGKSKKRQRKKYRKWADALLKEIFGEYLTDEIDQEIIRDLEDAGE